MGTRRTVSCWAAQLLQMRPAGDQADGQGGVCEERRSQPRLQEEICYMKAEKGKCLFWTLRCSLKPAALRTAPNWPGPAQAREQLSGDAGFWVTALHHNGLGKVPLTESGRRCGEPLGLTDRPLSSCHSEDPLGSLIRWHSALFVCKSLPLKKTLYCPLGLVPPSFRLSNMDKSNITQESVKMWHKAVLPVRIWGRRGHTQRDSL